MAKKLLCLLLTFIILFTLVPPTAVFAGEMAAEETEKPVVTLDDIIKAASEVIRQNEGNYSSVSPDDNGALSIGWIQWHANRALNLLKTIVDADTAKALEILGEALYNEIITSTSWSTRTLTEDERSKISTLIDTEAGRKAQDDLAAKDISSYINRAIGLGINDPAALVYFADVENQCGSGGSKRVAAAAAALAGSYEAITLEHMHEAAMADSIAGGKHSTRRQRTYNNCLLLDWEIISTKLEVWDILSARNVREKPDTSSTLVTTIAKGTKVIISEKVLFKNQTRGKTSMGWITLDATSCALNEELTGGYVPAPVTFDTNGGSFGSAFKSSLFISGTNCSRPADSIIFYDNDYPYSQPQTNQYGGEAAVGADGIVISAPTYGTCKTDIPEGGFVLSGIGTGHTSLSQNIKVGNYVRFDSESMTVYVYDSYEAYLKVSKAETVPDLKNDFRPANSLVLYDGEYQYGTPQTNEYGTEVAVDADGKVLNAPAYGLCKTPIPEGGFVLSGIGTGYTWLSQNIKVGDYVHLDRDTAKITVYSDRNKMLSATKTSAMGSPFGDLPIPKRSGLAFTGWYLDSSELPVQVTDICQSPFCITLKAGWKKTGDKLSFDANGGSFEGVALKKLDGVNVFRPAESLILYDNDYTSDRAPTNEYGGEAAVNAEGTVISAPTYGTCQTVIPEGGFVLSGIGAGHKWLYENVKVGSYVHYDKETGTVTVYQSRELYDSLNRSVVPDTPIGTLPEITRQYHKFLGWFTLSGTEVTADTLMPVGGLTLYAKWELLPGKLSLDAAGGKIAGLISSANLAGTNTYRAENSLVLYKDRASSGTNVYGSEAVILNDGTVLTVFPYGTGNTKIPKGAYVISGIGTMHTWLQQNLSQGNHVVIEDSKIYVWEDLNAYNARELSDVKYGERYGTLPTAKREGYVFLGWQDGLGNTVNSGDTVAQYGDVVLTAKWEKLCSVTLNCSGAKLLTSGVKTTASGINVSRGSNALTIYAGMATTGTNVYGSEAAVGADGTVLAVYPYGTGNSKIPEGGFVLSGNGSANTWLLQNLKAGYCVKLRGYTVTVYKDRSAADAEDGTLHLKKGSAITAIPTATLADKAFGGWFTSDGIQYKEGSVVSGDVTLFAKWSATSAALRYDTQGGSFAPAKGTSALNGINTSRGANQLILYNSDYYNSFPYTNAYGAEAAVNCDGTVISAPSYGTAKTPIPEGGFVLSGIGTGYSWLSKNVKIGNYVHYDENAGTVAVYESYGDYLASKEKIIKIGETYGDLPIPKNGDLLFAGWKDIHGNTVTDDTTVTDCENPVIYATWSTPAQVTFDTAGGSMVYTAATLSGTNISRGPHCLVLYKGRASTGTNIYGTEAIVNSRGEVVTLYYYGKGNNPIPEGCFALSGNGNMSDWISKNISEGAYVTVEGNTVRVYKNKLSYDAAAGSVTLPAGTSLSPLPVPSMKDAAFAGWYTAEGDQFTAGTAVDGNITLYARWSATGATLTFDTQGGGFAPAKGTCTPNGINVSRGSDQLILYNSSYYNSFPYTNAYGAEAAVNADGIVITAPVYGSCKTAIPEGGFVLSGIGAGYTWLSKNVKVGNYVRYDRDAGTVTVYESYNDYLGIAGKTVSLGKPYGPLPIPKNNGLLFMGWQDRNGNTVTESTVVTSCDDPVLFAVWKAPVTLTFDAKGGSFVIAKTTLSGTNIPRGSHCLVLYRDKATTGTNIYGTEAIVNGNGEVITVYYYGKGNNPIPEGCFALSGNGRMSDWVSANVTVGSYVSVSGNSVKVYKNKLSMDAEAGNVVIPEGDALSVLPFLTRYGYDFSGWRAGDGSILESGTPLYVSNTYSAVWTPKKITVTLDAGDGWLSPYATYTADGQNTYRGTGKLIIYDSTPTTGTNIYGTEVIVSADGTVTDIRPYGYGNAEIPEGGFVLSGHDGGAEWLKANVAIGDKVFLDGLNISVYKSGKNTVSTVTVSYGSPFGILPVPLKPGSTFVGWFATDGTKVSQNTLLTFADSTVTLIAKWE